MYKRAQDIIENRLVGNLANQPVASQKSLQSHSKFVQRETLQSASNRPVLSDGGQEHLLPVDRLSRENSVSSESELIGQDLWKQLQRVTIPTFSGDKQAYQNWKAAFMSCVDRAPAMAEYKLLQLRQCLAKEALKSIENLGYSSTAYEAAKDRLERKFGGQSRQIVLYLEEIDSFKPVRVGNTRDLEKLADLLDVAIVNLKEANRFDELKDGLLYIKLEKSYLPQC